MSSPEARRILIVMPLASVKGGAEMMLYHFMKYGRGLGVRWTVVFMEPGLLIDKIRELGVAVHLLNTGRLRQLHRWAAGVGRLRRMIRTEKFDAVFAWFGQAHFYSGPAAWLAGVPASWYQLGNPQRKSLYQWINHLIPSCGIISCSPDIAAAQRAFWPRRQERVVYPGVELDRFNPASLPTSDEARRELDLPPNGPIIGIVGRLQTWKGMHVLLQAMPAILAEHPDAHCLIVGGKHDQEPEYPDRLNDIIRSLKLEPRVILAGLQMDVPLWVSAMDVFVHASDHEPFGLVVLEGMAMAKPVVAGAGGGPRHIITPGRTGQLAPFGDHKALAAAILTFLNDRAAATRIAEAGRLRAQEFSVERYAQHLLSAILDLTGLTDRQPSMRMAQLSGTNVR